MGNFDATSSNPPSLLCYYCGRVIVDGHWFARVRHGDGHVAFCRPWCVELFLDHPEGCAGTGVASAWIGQLGSTEAQSRRAVAAASANYDRADGNLPMATPALSFVNS